MKSLYESILDSDLTIRTSAEKDIVPAIIAKCFIEVFGKPYIDPNSIYDRNHDHVIGRLNLDEYDKFDIYATLNKIEKEIKTFFSLIKKEFTGYSLVKCEKKHKRDYALTDYFDAYHMFISIRQKDEAGEIFGITILVDSGRKSMCPVYIKIISDDDGLKRALR